MKPDACVLVLNAGSSSIRFACYDVGASLESRISGKIDRIGSSRTEFTSTPSIVDKERRPLNGLDFPAVVKHLLEWLEGQPFFPSIRAVGHRFVHGMNHTEPERVTAPLLRGLSVLIPFAPDHLPSEIKLIEAFGAKHPHVPQVICFDTAFHREMPRVAKQLPIPRRYAPNGVERYGFHGISYSYLMEELGRIDRDAAGGRVILAHLGNGASLAAVRRGKSMDTSMGFTPASGLMMGTRTGDLDPGLVRYLAHAEGMTPTQFDKMINHESGLLGVSGASSDMRELLDLEPKSEAAAEAVALFCYQVKKWIGSFATVLGGLDTLVFAGGIGEHSAIVRERICADLGFLGIELDTVQNGAHTELISTNLGRVKVRVIPTNEELMIARSVCRLLNLRSG